MIAGLYKLMLSDVTTPVNLGNPSEITMLDLAHKIIAPASTALQEKHKDRGPRLSKRNGGDTHIAPARYSVIPAGQ